MLAALIIVFREVLEAGLIVGIVLAATRGVPGRSRFVAFGVVAGIAGAAVIAMFAGAIASLFEGAGQELFNAAILAVAVVMLAWHNIWMASHGAEMATDARHLGAAVGSGRRPLLALTTVIGIAVLREGSEVVLFLYGIAATGGTSAITMLAGGGLGVLGGAAVSGLIYGGLLAVPTRRIFAVTTGLVTLLAAGMASQAVAFLEQGGYAGSLDTPLWNSRWLLAEDSLAGRMLHTLVGYSDSPTGLQVMAYAATIIVILLLMRGVRWQRPAVG